MKVSWVIAVLTFVAFFQSYGQEKLSDTLKIRQVSVFGQKSPISSGYQTIDSLAFLNNTGATLGELLENNSVVFIKSAAPGSLATVSMRGTLASHTQVWWNGIRLNSPMLGQVDFSLIPSFFTDQIELSGGPASLARGTGALGGNINLQSFLNWTDPFFASAALQAGSFSTFSFRADAGGKAHKWNYRLRVFHERSKNDFDYLNTANGLFNRERQENAGFNKDGILAQVSYRINEFNLLLVQSWLQQTHRDLPPIMSYEGSGRTEYQDDDQIRVSASWQIQKQRFTSHLSGGLACDYIGYYLAHQNGGGLLVNYHTNSRSLSGYNRWDLGYQLNTIHHVGMNLRTGLHQVDILDEKTGEGYQADRVETGVQVRAAQTWSEKWSTYLLLTQDWIDGKRAVIVPAVGASLQALPEHLEVGLNLGRNYHAPTLNDLYWVPGGNPDLVPEEGYQGDLGIKSTLISDSLTNIDLSANLFVSLIDNWILWRPGEFRYWSPENLETVLARGTELQLKASRRSVYGTLKLNTNYAFTRTNQIEPIRSPQLIYIPVHKGNAMIHWDYHSWNLTYQFVYTSERYTSTAEELSYHRLPAFTLHNLGLGKQFILGKTLWDVRLQVRNLLDTDYQTILWRAMPGRNYSLDLTLKLK